MRIPAQYDFQAWANAGFEASCALFELGAPYDLTGVTAILLEIRAVPGQTGTALVTCNLASGLSITSATAGQFLWNVIPSVMATLEPANPLVPTSYYYDMVVTPATGQPFVAMQGSFIVAAGVAR